VKELSRKSLAQLQVECFCGETFSNSNWTVFYVNGISATPEKNLAALKAVKDAVTERYKPYIDTCDDAQFQLEAFQFIGQQNPSQKLLDVPETLAAIEGNVWIRKLRELYLALGGRDRGPNDSFADIIDVRPEIIDFAYGVSLNTVEADFVFQSAGQWSNELNKSRKRCPLVIGYSQGALLSNRIFLELETLEDPDCTSLIHIGTPDSIVYGEASNYITLEEDLIIQALRLSQAGNRNPLPSNTTNLIFQPIQEFGHSLTADYLGGGNSRNRINRALDNSVFCNSKGSLGLALPSVQSNEICPFLTSD